MNYAKVHLVQFAATNPMVQHFNITLTVWKFLQASFTTDQFMHVAYL
jgi:hypothetical protein